MDSRMFHTSWLLLTLPLKGILAGDWSVHLPLRPICTVVGSTVVLSCSYDYPQSSWEMGGERWPTGQPSISDGGDSGRLVETEYKVLSKIWCRGENRCITPRYVFHSAGIFPDPSFWNRVEYLGEPGTKNCSLKISGLRYSDSGTYVFYLITNHPTEKMPEQAGIQLLVTDTSDAVAASVGPSGVVAEGGSLRLCCCSPAAGPGARYSWYKSPGTGLRHDGQVWSVSDVKAAMTGAYYCQMQTGDVSRNSTTVAIDVQYPPRDMAVSILRAGGLPEGAAVALTCSSDANPPVSTYTWYRGLGCLTDSPVAPAGTGQTFGIANMSTGDPGPYCCTASNIHGTQNYSVTLGAATTTSKGRRLLAVGVTVAALVAVIGAAVLITRRQRATSSHQSYMLTDTNVSVL